MRRAWLWGLAALWVSSACGTSDGGGSAGTSASMGGSGSTIGAGGAGQSGAAGTALTGGASGASGAGASGGSAAGGSATGGSATGGSATGGSATGGSATGGASGSGGIAVAVDSGSMDSGSATGSGGVPGPGDGGTGSRDSGVSTSNDAGARDASALDARADVVAPDAAPPICNRAGAATAATPTIYVIGDSTASVYTADLFPRMGWAQPLQDYYTPACATIQDKALSGRSSKSFFDEGAWTPIRDALRAGDYVLIQFGHNDEKSDDLTLFTDPFTTYEQYLSIYLDDTIAKRATPILLTSINRNDWNGAGTALDDTHGNYPVAMRQLAAARGVSLVDTTALTKAYFERIGMAAATTLFMDLAPGQFPNYPAGNTDNTHLQEVGARTIARMILADLYRQRLPIGSLVKAVPAPL